METQAVVQTLLARTRDAGLAAPLCLGDETGSVTLQWTAHCIVCRVDARSQWIAVCGWGPLRALRRSFRGPAQVEAAAELMIDCALGAVTVSVQ
jgi:hypothetical protein